MNSITLEKPATTTSMGAADFDFIAGLVRRTAAIVIERGKEYFLETRLGPIAKQLGYKSTGEMIAFMRNHAVSQGLLSQVIDAITTNETYFFRDNEPFSALRTHVLPKLIERRTSQRRLSILSAACSTGQEPYSIAMLLREHFPQLASWTVSITATDLCTRVLEQARGGRYSQLEVGRGVPPNFLEKYFRNEGPDRWVVKEDIRRMVEFRAMNLIDPWPQFQPFDVVFLRNVMIYFDVPTKRAILGKVRNILRSDGALFLGGAESTTNIDPTWVPTSCGRTTIFKPAPTIMNGEGI